MLGSLNITILTALLLFFFFFFIVVFFVVVDVFVVVVFFSFILSQIWLIKIWLSIKKNVFSFSYTRTLNATKEQMNSIALRALQN